MYLGCTVLNTDRQLHAVNPGIPESVEEVFTSVSKWTALLIHL